MRKQTAYSFTLCTPDDEMRAEAVALADTLAQLIPRAVVTCESFKIELSSLTIELDEDRP